MKSHLFSRYYVRLSSRNHSRHFCLRFSLGFSQRLFDIGLKLTALFLFVLGSACLDTYTALTTYGNLSPERAFKRKIAYDGERYLYVSYSNLHTIERVDTTDNSKIVYAGASGQSGTTDGSLLNARFNVPTGMAYKGGANPKLYVISSSSCTLRQIDVNTGIVSTVVGVAASCTSTDGTGTSARIASQASDLALDDNTLYLSETVKVRKVDLSNYQVTSVFGGNVGTYLDGIGTNARFNSIQGLTVANGSLYISESSNLLIRKANLTTLAVTTVSGTYTESGFVDGAVGTSKFNNPLSLSYDGNRYIYIADRGNHSIRRLDTQNDTLSTVFGQPTTNRDTAGALTSSTIAQPIAASYTNKGLFVVTPFHIRKIY